MIYKFYIWHPNFLNWKRGYYFLLECLNFVLGIKSSTSSKGIVFNLFIHFIFSPYLINAEVWENLLGTVSMGVVRSHCLLTFLLLFEGILYAGLMLTADGPKTLEFNCRFGDPETQVVLPLLKSDLYLTMKACVDGQLQSQLPIFEENKSAVCVVVASGGYPGSYKKGFHVQGTVY